MGPSFDLRAVTGHCPGEFAAELRIAGDLPLLGGHFPGAPLVPGVLLLEAVRQAAERVTGTALRLVGVDAVRFAAPLRPDQPARLTAVGARDGPTLVVDGSWQRHGERLASFTVRLQASD